MGIRKECGKRREDPGVEAALNEIQSIKMKEAG